MSKEEMIDQLGIVGELSNNDSVKEIVKQAMEFIKKDSKTE